MATVSNVLSFVVCAVRTLSDCFFFFKQKTAYEMRISDWSSDVCSSDLRDRPASAGRLRPRDQGHEPRPARRAGRVLQLDGPRHRGRSEERRVGKGVSVRVDLGGRRIIKKKNRKTVEQSEHYSQTIRIK